MLYYASSFLNAVLDLSRIARVGAYHHCVREMLPMEYSSYNCSLITRGRTRSIGIIPYCTVRVNAAVTLRPHGSRELARRSSVLIL